MTPAFLQVCFFSSESTPLRQSFMPLIAMVSPSTTKAVPQMSALTTPLSGGGKMTVKGLIPLQMTYWSRPGWGHSPPLGILQSAGFGSLSGSTMRCTNAPATSPTAPRSGNRNSFVENPDTVMLQQSNEQYDVSDGKQNLHYSERQSPFYKTDE